MAKSRVTAVVVALALSVSACSQGSKQDAVDRVRASIPTTRGEFIAGSYTLTVEPQKIGGTRQVQVRGGLLSVADFVAEPAARRSGLLVRSAPGVAGPATPVFLDIGRSLYGRRATQSARERRPWIKIDLDRISESDTPTLRALAEQAGPGDAVVVNPQLLLDTLAGALTGSIEQSSRGDGATVYRFNLSIDKANRALDLDEDQRDDRAKLLKTLAISGDVHRAEVVVRRDGSLARLTVVLTERPDKQAALELHAELRVDAKRPTAVTSLATPLADETVRVGSVGDIRATVAEHVIKAIGGQQAEPTP